MANKNYSNFTRTRPNKGFYQPENHRKEREGEKGTRTREKKKKRVATVLSFYTVNFRDKNNCEGISQTLTWGDLVFKNPAGLKKTVSMNKYII